MSKNKLWKNIVTSNHGNDLQLHLSNTYTGIPEQEDTDDLVVDCNHSV